MKSREQKLADMEAVLAGVRILGAAIEEDEGGAYRVYVSPADLAERLLDAAEREAPKWPADASLDFFLSADGTPLIPTAKDTPEDLRRTLRAAFLADPIIQAAIRWAPVATVSPNDPMPLIRAAKDLAQAVQDAGLLGGTEGK